MTPRVISSFRMAMIDSCAECDMGILDFAAKYKGNASKLFHLCVRHKLALDGKECIESVANQLLLISSKIFGGAGKSRAGQKKKINKVPVESRSLQEHFL